MAKPKTTKKKTAKKTELTEAQKAARARASARAKELRKARRKITDEREQLHNSIVIEMLNITPDMLKVEGYKEELRKLVEQEELLTKRRSAWEEGADGTYIRDIRVNDEFTIEGKVMPVEGGASGTISLLRGGVTVLQCGGAAATVGGLQKWFAKVSTSYRAVVKLETAVPETPAQA